MHNQNATNPQPQPLPIPENLKGRARREGDHLWVRLAPDVELELVRVPEGLFWMGTYPKVDSEAFSDEQPVHQVWLDEYWIGRYPVTQAQYQTFINANPQYRVPFYPHELALPYNWDQQRRYCPAGKENHPVVWVTWQDAQAFCQWVGLGLPGEAQWEKAARGTDGRRYPWGNEAPVKERCNINQWYGGTTPVGQFSPLGDSPYGCADMAGNVYEWCQDWYAESYYGESPNRNPPGPQSGDWNYRVVRGGAWYNVGRLARCATRFGDAPGGFNVAAGFRVAVQILLPSER